MTKKQKPPAQIVGLKSLELHGEATSAGGSNKPKAQVIGLKTLDLRGEVGSVGDVPEIPHPIRGGRLQMVGGEPVPGAGLVQLPGVGIPKLAIRPRKSMLKVEMPKYVSLPGGARPQHKNVFTDEKWAKLNAMPTRSLRLRIRKGHYLIRNLHSPEKLNMTKGEAAKISSNLRFQIDEIQRIIDRRKEVGLSDNEKEG